MSARPINVDFLAAVTSCQLQIHTDCRSLHPIPNLWAHFRANWERLPFALRGCNGAPFSYQVRCNCQLVNVICSRTDALKVSRRYRITRCSQKEQPRTTKQLNCWIAAKLYYNRGIFLGSMTQSPDKPIKNDNRSSWQKSRAASS